MLVGIQYVGCQGWNGFADGRTGRSADAVLAVKVVFAESQVGDVNRRLGDAIHIDELAIGIGIRPAFEFPRIEGFSPKNNVANGQRIDLADHLFLQRIKSRWSLV